MSIGQVFLGKYRVDEILGHGGMGVVAKCMHLQLNEQVAIKMLRKDVLLDRDAVERFMREAQAAVKLRSEYVARVSDVGTFENGVPYMVMEFLDGHDLGELIDDRGCLPAPWATELMLQAAEALSEAHSIGIVHRDVKPTNLFVTWRPDGSALIKVLDFGISKAPIGTDMQLTQTQSLLGTPAYMSPEQMRSARMVDARSDIWSLGTVMYELLEGRRPFEAESFSEMCVKVAVDPPSPMVNTPPALQPVVLRCLAKSAEQRYANMAELGRALVPFAPDAHQAAMLVERMQRMLGRRSHVDWDNSTRTPQHVRDLKSAPIAVPAQQRHGTSEAAAAAYRATPMPGVPQQLTHHEPSAPASAQSEVMFAPKKSKAPIVFLVCAAIVGIVIGLALTFGGGDGDKVAQPTVTPGEPKPPPVGSDSTPTTPPVVDHKAPVPPPDLVVQPVEIKNTDDKPPDKATTQPVKKDPSKQPAIKKDPIKQQPDKTVKKDPIVKPPDPVPVPQPCDVYMYPHGCPKAPAPPSN